MENLLTPISKIIKELEIEAHQLREWEKRDWLGDVLKDPNNNNQRVYNEEQVKRIHLIRETIKSQREKGFKRTDLTDVEDKLLETFGGEVTKKETEIVIHSSSIKQMSDMFSVQQTLLMEMKEKIENLERKEFPAPIDYKEQFEDMKIQFKFNQEREEKLLGLVQKLQDDIEKLKKMPPKSRWKFW